MGTAYDESGDGGTLDFVGAIARESDRFLVVLGDVDPAARVPSCPDWDAADLLWHLAEVQWFWATIVEERRRDADGMSEPVRPSSYDDMHTFGREQAARLAQVLADADPATPVYMWAPDKTAGYIGRRQAHEALIHRLDAELTADSVTPMDPALASDGVLEALEVMHGLVPPWGTFAPGGDRVCVECSDTGLTVPVRLGWFTGTDPDDGAEYDEAALVVQRSPGEPSATVTGTADDLDAWLWRRRPASALRVTGDQAAFDRLTAAVSPID
jgi:uncharacterized protein (TIGR03083 family)